MFSRLKGEKRFQLLSYFSGYETSAANQIGNGERKKEDADSKSCA